MRNRKRMLIVMLAAMMFSVSAFSIGAEAASKTFFSNKPCQGFYCTATGSIGDSSCSANFSATAMPGTTVMPGESYSSAIFIANFDTNNTLRGTHFYYGTTNCSGSVIAVDYYMGHIECEFRFQNTTVTNRTYTLTNN